MATKRVTTRKTKKTNFKSLFIGLTFDQDMDMAELDSSYVKSSLEENGHTHIIEVRVPIPKHVATRKNYVITFNE